jgi:hypothetical protein
VHFLGGSQGGAGCPPGYAERSASGGSPDGVRGSAPSTCSVEGNAPKFFFLGGFLLFLAIFS